MKKLLLAVLIVLAVVTTKAQISRFSVTVMDPLPTLDFAGFVITNDLRGTPLLFTVNIEPDGVPVRLEGSISWKDIAPGSSFVELAYFKSRVFTSRNFTNQDLGSSDFRIESDRVNRTEIDKNIAKGKPTGTYILRLTLLTPAGLQYPGTSTFSHELTFFNPSQTLSIMFPTQGLNLDQGNVVAVWNNIVGANSYKIRANVRANAAISLVDALNASNPIINNRDVGNVTSVNLRTILDREWSAGQEIVMQVSAVIPGPGGGTTVFSEPISFTLTQLNVAQYTALLNNVNTLIQLFPNVQIPSTVLSQLLTGNVQLTGFTNENGQILTQADIQNILNYLATHPEDLLRIFYRPGTGTN